MEDISRVVDQGKEVGLSDQDMKDAVREGVNRHERRANAHLRRKERRFPPPVSRIPVSRVPDREERS